MLSNTTDRSEDDGGKGTPTNATALQHERIYKETEHVPPPPPPPPPDDRRQFVPVVIQSERVQRHVTTRVRVSVRRRQADRTSGIERRGGCAQKTVKVQSELRRTTQQCPFVLPAEYW